MDTALDTLKDRLRALYAQRPDWYRALLDELAARLAATACRMALGPGDAMPDFVLPTAAGDLVLSDELLARGPLVLIFFRGGWCPFCQETLRTMDGALAEIAAAGASVVALTPDGGGYALEAQRALGLHFPVLCDIDHAIGLRFGTTYRVPDAIFDALHGWGVDLSERHGDDLRFLPMPATYVVDRDGIIRFAHVSGDIADRADPAAVVAALHALA